MVNMCITTLCPSGLRGWAQVPLARAAWAQIPQVSYGGHPTTMHQLSRYLVSMPAVAAHMLECVLIPCVGAHGPHQCRCRSADLPPSRGSAMYSNMCVPLSVDMLHRRWKYATNRSQIIAHRARVHVRLFREH